MKNKLIMFFAFIIVLPLNALNLRKEVKSAIDEAAVDENWGNNSAYLEKEHQKLIDYVSTSTSVLAQNIVLYTQQLKSKSLASLITIATFVAFEKSSGFVRETESHLIQARQRTIEQNIEKFGFKSCIEQMMAETKTYLQMMAETKTYLRHCILFSNLPYRLSEYFYAMSKGVWLYTLPNQVIDGIHQGLFATPLEVFTHDFSHVYDIFGNGEAIMLVEMTDFAKDFVAWLEKKTLTLTKASLRKATIIAFVLTHESGSVRKLNAGKSANSQEFLKYLKANIIEYFGYLLNCADEKSYYQSLVLNTFETKETVQESIKYESVNEKKETVPSYMKYESIKIFYSDLARFLALIEVGKFEIASSLTWNPHELKDGFLAAIEWFEQEFAQ